MVWRGVERDPTVDRAAPDVIAAYEAAVAAGRSGVECYRAGVEAWCRAHPDQTAAYAGKQAVAVILAAKQKSMLRVE